MKHISQNDKIYLLEKIKKTYSSKLLIEYMIKEQSWREVKEQFWFPFQIQEEKEKEEVYFYLIYEDIRNNYVPIYQLLKVKSDYQQNMTNRLTQLTDLIPFIDELHSKQLFIFDISLQNVWFSKSIRTEISKYKILNRGIYQFYFKYWNDKTIQMDEFLNVYKWQELYLVSKPFLGKYLSCQQSNRCNCSQINQRNSNCGLLCEKNENCKYCLSLKLMDCQRNQDLHAVFILLYYMTYPKELAFQDLSHDNFDFQQQMFGNIEKTEEDKKFYSLYFSGQQKFSFKILEFYFNQQLQQIETYDLLKNKESFPENDAQQKQMQTIDMNQTQELPALDENTKNLIQNDQKIKQLVKQDQDNNNISNTVSTQYRSLIQHLDYINEIKENMPYFDKNNEFFKLLKDSEGDLQEYEINIIMLSILYFNSHCVILETLDNKELVILQIQIFWQLIFQRFQNLQNQQQNAQNLFSKVQFIYDQIKNDDRLKIPDNASQTLKSVSIKIKRLQNTNTDLKMEISTINTAIKQLIQKKFINKLGSKDYKYFKLINYFQQILFCQYFNYNNDMKPKFENVQKKIINFLQNQFQELK
ncbi:hypothetical protein ABPG74_001326 [Tetrahymena malaccensis]